MASIDNSFLRHPFLKNFSKVQLRSIFLIAFTVLQLSLNAQDNLTYYKVLINYTENNVFETLAENNLYVDHAAKADNGFVVVFDNNELETLKLSGVSYKILIDDLEAYNRKRIAKDAKDYELQKRLKKNEPGFDLGSHAGYYTPQEMVNKLDELATNYPSIVAPKEVIGTTYEGKDIHMLKISDNPNIDESADEPVVYYDAMQHAREPLSMMSTMYYMFWLVENYGTDPVATKLINERELYFVPIVNVDGYEYNITTNPDGGGLWRKTRRPNPGSSCIGTDPNRNYGADWGQPGASDDPCSDTYRGETAFSENCTQAVRDFLEVIEPVTAFSTHSYSEIYLEPDWDLVNQEQFFVDYSLDICEHENFPYGRDSDLLYATSGTTRDYITSLGATAYTPEIGTEFWEPATSIETYAQKHLPSFIYIAQVAGDYPDVKQAVVNGDANLLPGENFNIDVEIFNKGKTKPAQNISVEVVSHSQNVTIANSQTILIAVPARQAEWTDSNSPISIAIDNNAIYGDVVELELTVTADGIEYEREKHSWIIGEQYILFSEDGSDGVTSFSQNTNTILWDTTYVMKRSGNESFADSKVGSARNRTESYFSMTAPVNLGNFSVPVLEFWIAWGLANHTRSGGIPSEHKLCLQMKLDNGDWTNVETDMTNSQNCYVLNNGWVQQIVDLYPYKGATVQFRFALNTTDRSRPDGVFIDDLRIVDYQDNAIILPVAIIDGDNEITINEGESVTLTQSSTDYDSILWNSGDDQTSTESEANFTYSTYGTYTIYLEASNSNGISVDSISLIVNPIGLLDCPTEEIRLLSQEDVDEFVRNYSHCTSLDVDDGLYIWSQTGTPINDLSGLAFITNLNNKTLYIRDNPQLVSLNGLQNIQNVDVFFLAGNLALTDCNYENICNFTASSNVVTFVVNNGVGCDDEEIIEDCHGTDLPTAAIKQTGPITIFVGDTVFLDNASIKYVDLLWVNGSRTSTGTNVFSIFDEPGTFTITLTATNANGSDTASITIIVIEPGNNLPVAVIDGSIETTINEGESIDLTQSSTNYDSLLWNSGDGQTSSEEQVSFTYNTAGTYTVTLEATNADGTDEASITVFVNEQSQCINSSLIEPQAICATVFDPVCGCNGQDYSNTCVASTQFGVSEFTVGDCINPYVDTFTICEGESVQLNPSENWTGSSTWSPTTGLSCIDCRTPMASPSETTTYTLTAPIGDITIISKFKVEVDQNCTVPVAIINGSSEIAISEGESIDLTQSSTNYDSLLWNSGDGQTLTDSEVTFTYNTTGTYTVTLEATNTNGSDITEITVIVNKIDVANENCDGDTLIYTTSNTIPDGTHKKMKDWIALPGNNGPVEVKNGVDVSFKAGNYIEINGDFEVEVGAEFLLDIEDCEEQECTSNFNNLLGGDLIDEIYSMEITNDGGYILAGASFSSNSGDITGINTGDADYWVTKLDANATIEWSKLLGNNSAYSIIQTADGNYVVNGTADDASVKTIKLDANGNEIWNNIYSRGAEYAYIHTDIIETSTGDFVGTGYSFKDINNGTNYTGFIYKLNNEGNLEWEKELPFRQFSVVEATNGNYIVNSYTDFIGVFGATDIVLTEFDTDGGYTSDNSFGTNFGEVTQEMQATNDGGYIISGTVNERRSVIGGVFDDYNFLIIKVAADGTRAWQKTYGGDEREYLYSIAQTDDGGYILGGYSESSNNGNVTKTNNGGRDFWIVKLNASGNIEWENLVGSSADDIPRSVRQAADGGYVVAGYTENGTGGDLIEESNGGTDGWFLKLNANGEIEETTPCDTTTVEIEPVDSIGCRVNNLYGGSGVDYVEYMEVTTDGGYIMAGYTTSSQTGDIPEANAGANDFWVMKLSKNGAIDWSRLYGESDQDKAYSIRQTTDGGYVVAGTSLPPDSINYVGSVIKLDSNGEQIWESPISNEGLDLSVREIIETNDGGYMTIGYFTDGTQSNSFTIKLDANGDLTGARSYGISNALSVDQAPNGNYYLSGYDNFTTGGVEDNIWIAYLDKDGANIIWQNIYGVETADERCIDGVVLPDGKYVAGGSTEESGNYDYQIFKVDTTGNLVWATVIGGDGREVVYSIETTNDGGFIVGGYSDSSNSGDVDTINNGERDFWIVKLNPAGSVEWKTLIGGNRNEEPRSVHQTDDGGYIVAGNSLSSNNGDIEDASNGGRDVWFVKLNANGEIEETGSCINN